MAVTPEERRAELKRRVLRRLNEYPIGHGIPGTIEQIDRLADQIINDMRDVLFPTR